MGTSRVGNADVSAVLGRWVLGLSMTTLKVVEWILWERACSLMVENEWERACLGSEALAGGDVVDDCDGFRRSTFTTGVGERAAGVDVCDAEGRASVHALLGRRRGSGERQSRGGVVDGDGELSARHRDRVRLRSGDRHESCDLAGVKVEEGLVVDLGGRRNRLRRLGGQEGLCRYGILGVRRACRHGTS